MKLKHQNKSFLTRATTVFSRAMLIYVLLIVVLMPMAQNVSAEGGAIVTTDKADYAPEETVLISGSGFNPSTALTIEIKRPDGAVESCSSVDNCHSRFNGPAVTDSNGAFSGYTYDLDGILGLYNLTVSDGTNTATTMFTDKPVFTVTITSPANSSTVTNPVRVYGTWNVTNAPGNLNQYNVSVTWGDGNVDSAVNIVRNSTEHPKHFWGTFDTNPGFDHTYATQSCQKYNITVKLYHAESPGGESDDATAVTQITISEVCNDGVDNDCDGFTDCADSNCTADSSCGNCESDDDCNALDTDCAIGVCNAANQCEQQFKSDTTECKASAGVCDVAEMCTGQSADCPTDVFKSSTEVCRPATGPCDVAESCTGSNAACLADNYQPNGTACDGGLYCDGAEKCNGAGVCLPDTAVNCSVYNILEVATCDNDPDNIHATYDSRISFISTCDEDTDKCTTGNDSISHSCSNSTCGAACEIALDCVPKREGDICYYDSYCAAQVDCTCHYLDSEFCPALGTVFDGICYYGTGDCTDEGCSLTKVEIPAGNCYTCDPTLGLVPDTTGPVTSNVTVVPAYNNGYFNLDAFTQDICSNIAEAEYFFGYTTTPTCTGLPFSMPAKDGVFDSKSEELQKINAEYSHDGLNWVCVRSKDTDNNWGNCACAYFEVDNIPPEMQRDVILDGVKNPKELLVCGKDPVLQVTICDSQSSIQGGEYFLDKWIPPEPQPAPWTGYWLEPYAQFIDAYTGWHCANLSAMVDAGELTEGTHYINQIRGKDTVENWGKIYGQNFNFSFIKDTIAPSTTKELMPADNASVACNITSINGKTITNGCTYVKPGTEIKLTAVDPDTQQTGEFAGDVIIHYNIYWSYDGTSWALSQSGTSSPDQPLTLTLNDDSYHLIEYWSEDGCGNAEEKHYELDIVDGKVPITAKSVSEIKHACEGGEGCDWYMTSNTEITLSCLDQQPHPVNDVKIHYKIDWKELPGDSWIEGEWVTNGDMVKISYKEDSFHRLNWYCEDALGNKESTRNEIDIVDNKAPQTVKEIIGPKYVSGDKTFVDGVTRIKMTCTDAQPHPVDHVNVYYRYRVDEGAGYGDWTEWTQYTEEFGFSEESKHEMEYYCIDALNNEETHLFEIDFVDKTPPVTTKTYGKPFYTNSGREWISFDTSITLSATDGESIHASGVQATDYRVTLVDDAYCASAEACAGGATGNGAWNTYVDPFKIGGESCHLIEFYSKDNVEKTESTKRQCAFVQNSAPVSWKEVGTPKVPYGPAEEGNFYVTQATSISLFCEEKGAHPTGTYNIYYRWNINSGGWNDWNLYTSQFTYTEDSNHTLEWYCIDGLDKASITYTENDIVDTLPPVITKTIGEPKYTKGDDLYITQATPITLTCLDQQPHPVDDVTIYYRYRVKDDFGSEWNAWNNWVIVHAGNTTFSFPEDSIHELEYKCNDALGNAYESQTEIDIVDTHAPSVSKAVGDPKIAADNNLYTTYPDTFNVMDDAWYIPQQTPITLGCEDGGFHSVGDVKIYYKYYNDGNLVQDWILYNGPFTYGQDTYHQLYYYCEDALGNEGDVHYELDIVDTQAPNTAKALGDPKHACTADEQGIYYPSMSEPTNGCYFITQATPITLTCTDGQPHPVDDVTLYYRDYLLDQEVPQFIEVDGSSVEIMKNEDSAHVLEWYCVDALGNTEALKTEYDIVDTEAPVTTKIVGEPKVACKDGDCDWWISQSTTINLDCNDLGPHPVNHVKLYWRDYRVNETAGNWNMEASGVANIQKKEDCRHVLEWYCVDELGNTETQKIEYDQVDTEAPHILDKFVVKDGVKYTEEAGQTITIPTQGGVNMKFCADVEDFKQTGDAGVGVDKVWTRFSFLNDPQQIELTWDDEEQAYCTNYTWYDCGRWHFEVMANDLLGNQGEWIDGIEILIDNVPPTGIVFNPHAGNNYYAGKIFPFYAPAVDFGGDHCDCGCEGQNCPASGVDYCDIYAIDYNFEGLNQSQIKECFEDLSGYLEQVGANPYIEYIGRVPYENGVCKGYLTIVDDTKLTDTVFMAWKIVDKAGNGVNTLHLALNPGELSALTDFQEICDPYMFGTPITMNMEQKGMLSITEMFNSPVTSNDMLVVKAKLNESGVAGNKECVGIVEKYGVENITSYVTSFTGDIIGNVIDGYNCILSGSLPDYSEISSGLYRYTVEYRLNDDLQIEVLGSDWFDFTVDNTRPYMGVISPIEGGTYSSLVPVSIHTTDDSSIAPETVKIRIQEKGTIGNLWCLNGGCADTGWVQLAFQHDDLYSKVINLTEFGLQTDGKYTFDAIACDILYQADPADKSGLGLSLGLDRNVMHCEHLLESDAEQIERPECNDGLDNDMDSYIDYALGDDGCYGTDDTSEGADCGNGYIEAIEECDAGVNNGVPCEPGYNSTCDYCSATCELVTLTDGYCGDGTIQSPNEQCENDTDCSEGYTCSDCQCIPVQVESVCGNDIVELGEQCDRDSTVCGGEPGHYQCFECQCIYPS